MVKEALASMRIDPKVKREIEMIAVAESRSLSNVLELLMLRGLRLYRKDGQLVERAPKRRRSVTRP